MKPEDKILTESDFKIHGDKVKLDVWLRKHEMKQILESLEFYDIVKNGEICNIMKHRELEQENKELNEKEIELTEWIANLIRSSEKNKETIQKVREEIKELKENSDKWIKYLSESPTGTLKIILNLESQVKELTEEILKEKGREGMTCRYCKGKHTTDEHIDSELIIKDVRRMSYDT